MDNLKSGKKNTMDQASSSTEGKYGQRFVFEVAAWDDLSGSRESFTDVAESIILIDALISNLNDAQFSSEVSQSFYLK
jgi:hypothetical protein